ncbi:hypothetical protein BpHYR1_047175 [Brachionus plicatilis]|uniref:Uncharacterized protein n=1 Tax=Brachionus plicatilis TaxID=10195 RepID=A0A3M7S1T1_BRAPC|nr:hypothetical protein BpHYR1_047175 [Brachionus plicatilis]
MVFSDSELVSGLIQAECDERIICLTKSAFMLHSFRLSLSKSKLPGSKSSIGSSFHSILFSQILVENLLKIFNLFELHSLLS